MTTKSKSFLKTLSPSSQIDLMIAAIAEYNMPLLKNLVQILIEEDRIHEINILDDHQQQVFLQTLEQLLISAIHHHNQNAFLQIINCMQTTQNYAHPIDFYYDIIPLRNFADALAEKHHEAFLSLIRKKHVLNDDYLLFLAFKTENLKLLNQLILQGLHLHHKTIDLFLEQKILISSEPQRQFIQYLVEQNLEKSNENKLQQVKKK